LTHAHLCSPESDGQYRAMDEHRDRSRWSPYCATSAVTCWNMYELPTIKIFAPGANGGSDTGGVNSSQRSGVYNAECLSHSPYFASHAKPFPVLDMGSAAPGAVKNKPSSGVYVSRDVRIERPAQIVDPRVAHREAPLKLREATQVGVPRGFPAPEPERAGEQHAAHAQPGHGE
jgi:hypothetical protein